MFKVEGLSQQDHFKVKGYKYKDYTKNKIEKCFAQEHFNGKVGVQVNISWGFFCFTYTFVDVYTSSLSVEEKLF